MSNPEKDKKPQDLKPFAQSKGAAPQMMGGPGRPGGPGGRGPGGPMGARLNKEKPKNMGKTIWRLISYIGRSKYAVLGLLLIISAVTVADLFGPTLQGKAIDAFQMVDGKLTVDFDAM